MLHPNRASDVMRWLQWLTYSPSHLHSSPTIWKSQKGYKDESDTNQNSKVDQILCSEQLFSLSLKEGLAEHMTLNTGQMRLAAAFSSHLPTALMRRALKAMQSHEGLAHRNRVSQHRPWGNSVVSRGWGDSQLSTGVYDWLIGSSLEGKTN